MKRTLALAGAYTVVLLLFTVMTTNAQSSATLSKRQQALVGNLVLCYRDFRYSSGLVLLGKLNERPLTAGSNLNDGVLLR
ncbi:hypothetical protein Q3A66_01930 [Hymenobacter sp. BT770]|uniref:hypothetical protein n=1 Tax=Hymenobacter sp. BT770 TaxID=2886942 RepID=UPI001D12AB69|nr:hypothetical protein [Hymenobacter sp. BT770]MCC3151612.1 hypothetical protein [Hymenobacter sp. BT770]MDO3413810.1 hypothetical protein [Hymenobacter sp. BT770]